MVKTESYFQALKKQKRVRNQIIRLMDDSRNMLEEEEGLVAISTSYFRFLIK